MNTPPSPDRANAAPPSIPAHAQAVLDGMRRNGNPTQGQLDTAAQRGSPSSQRSRGRKSPSPGKSSKETFMASQRAPETSHIGQFGVSGDELFVTFKKDGGGETQPYIYQFETPAEAAAVFQEMAGSPHPYSSVLYPDVILSGIPYYQG